MIAQIKKYLQDERVASKFPNPNMEYAYNILLRDLIREGMSETNASILLSDIIVLTDALKKKGYTKTSSTRMKFLNILKNYRIL